MCPSKMVATVIGAVLFQVWLDYLKPVFENFTFVFYSVYRKRDSSV